MAYRYFLFLLAFAFSLLCPAQTGVRYTTICLNMRKSATAKSAVVTTFSVIFGLRDDRMQVPLEDREGCLTGEVPKGPYIILLYYLSVNLV
jgi:hypothetical protein